jgi:hypothetical protein
MRQEWLTSKEVAINQIMAQMLAFLDYERHQITVQERRKTFSERYLRIEMQWKVANSACKR